MNNRNGALSFEAYMGTDEFARGMKRMEDLTRGTTRTIVNESEKIDQSFKRLGQLAAGYLTFNQLSQLPGQIVRVRGEFQQLEIALNTMLGSKSKADALMGEIVQTAATTPFGMKDLAAGTKQLLAYGSASESVIGEIRMLGDVASGVSVPINDLIYLYGTLRSQGRAYAVDIRQFAGRGIPIYAELAKVLNVQVGEVNALVEAGRVGFPQVEQAFRNMTSAGGMFTGLMDAQSKSLPGMIERLKDAVDQMFNDIGRSNQAFAEGVIQGAAGVVEHYEEIADVLTILISTYGAYKAAVLAAHAINVVSTSSAYIAEADALSALLGLEAKARISKLGFAAGSMEHAAAIKSEIQAITEANTASVEEKRLSVSLAAAKKAETLEAAKAASAKLAEARANLLTAQANQAASAQYIDAKVRENAAREVAKAQEVVVAAQERAAITRKAALAASSEFYSEKAALETVATTASTTAKTVSAAAEVRLTAAQQLRAAVTTRLIALQTAFNASLLSNPIVLATVALVGMTAAMWALHDSTTAQELAQKSLNKLTEDAARKKQELESRTASLNGIVRDENQTKYAQLKAFTDLQKLYPALLGQMKLHEFQALSTAKAQKILNEAIEGISLADSKKSYQEAVKRVEKLQAHLNRLKDAEKGSSGGGDYGLVIGKMTVELAAAKAEAEKLGDQLKEEERLGWLANAPNEEKLKYYQSQLESKKKERSELEKIAVGADAIKRIFAEMSLIGINKEIKDLHGNVKAVQDLLNPEASAADGGNKAHWEKIKKDAEDARALLGIGKEGSAQWKEHTKNIEEANRKLQAYSTTSKKVAEKDKPQPFGSIAYWNQVAQKAQEVIEKTNSKTGSATIRKQQEVLQNAQLMAERARLNATPFGTIPYWEQVQKIASQIIANTPLSNKSEIEKQKNIIADAQQKADDIRRQLAVKSFDEELEYKRSQYELFERWVQHMGESVAKDQFSSLLSNGSSLVDYLEAEIKKLETQAITPGVGLIAPEYAQLEKLKEALNTAKGGESPIDAFTKDLERAREEAGNLVEYLGYLEQQQSKLDGNNSALAWSKKQIISEERLGADKGLKNDLNSLLTEVNANGMKRLAVEKKYIALRQKAEKESSGKVLEERIKLLDRERNLEIEAIKDEEFERSASYKKLHQEYLDYGRKQIKQRIKEIEEALAKEVMSAKTREQLELQLAKTRRELNKNTADGFREAASLVSNILGNADIKISENFKISMQQVSTAMNNVANLMDDSASTTSQVGSIIGIISFVITSARDAMLKASDLATEMDGQVSYYQNIANEIAGINILLERQLKLLDDLQGLDRAQGALSLYEQYGKQQEELWTRLKDLSVDTIKSQKEVFVDPVFGTELENKGFKGFWTSIMTGGQAKTKIKYEFENVDTSGFDDIEDYRNLLAEIKAGGGKLYGKEVVESDIKALEELIAAYDSAVEQQKALMEELKSYFTGTTVEGIADAIIEGFRQGKTSAADFADTFEQLMINAIINSFKAQVISKGIEQFYGKFSEYALSDFELTKAEIDDLKTDWKDMSETWPKMWEQIQQVTGMDLNKALGGSNTALTGAIKGMSEETASVLAGQFNAIRIYNAQIAFDVRGSLLLLSNISNNSNYLKRLDQMTVQMDRLIEQNNRSLRGFGF